MKRSDSPILLTCIFVLAALACSGRAPAQERGVRLAGAESKQWAIIIGISDYQNDRKARGEQGLPDLAGAANDAQAYYDFLAGPQHVPKDRLVLLKDSQASVRAIRRAFLTLGRQAGENDQFLVFFAGHGIAGPEAGNRSYLLAYDSDLSDLEATAILFDEFALWVQNEIPANKKLLVVDACHSGNFLGSIRGASRNQINDQMMERLRASQGTAFVTASSGSQVSVEQDGRGLFTRAWIEGLSGKADRDRDGIVTVSEAYQYAYQAVTGDPRTRQSPTQGGSYDFGMPLALAEGGKAAAEPPRREIAAVAAQPSSAPPLTEPATRPPAPSGPDHVPVLADGSWELPEISPPSGPPGHPTVSVSARATAESMGRACALAASQAAQEYFQGRPPTRKEYESSVYRLYCNTVHRTFDAKVRVEVVIEFFKEAEHGT
ncbi:MAG: caspase family protein [Thermodesulfobacteriota bacterium]